MGNKKFNDLETIMGHQGLKVYRVYINDDFCLTYHSKVKFGKVCLLCLYQTNSQMSVYSVVFSEAILAC